jgi:hypothetical protein
MKTKQFFIKAFEQGIHASLCLDNPSDRETLAEFLASLPESPPYRAGNSRSDVRAILGALAYCHESAAYWISCDEHSKAQEYLETAERHVKALVRLNETPS